MAQVRRGLKGLFLHILSVFNNNTNNFFTKTLHSLLKQGLLLNLLNTFRLGKEIYCFSFELSLSEQFLYFQNNLQMREHFKTNIVVIGQLRISILTNTNLWTLHNRSVICMKAVNGLIN